MTTFRQGLVRRWRRRHEIQTRKRVVKIDSHGLHYKDALNEVRLLTWAELRTEDKSYRQEAQHRGLKNWRPLTYQGAKEIE